MAIEPTSSFPPVESVFPPKPSRWKAVLSAIVFVMLLGAVWLFLRIADLSFVTGMLLDR